MQGLFQPHRYKVFHGGRGGAKSWNIARALLILGIQRPLRILCAREFQNSIKDSVHKLLSDQITMLGFDHLYDIQATAIKGVNGTEFGFEGLRLNTADIKSWEGADICWVEEAATVSKNSWKILIPTIRKPGSEIWVSFNPEFEDDETYSRFITNTPPNTLLVEMNYRDNPWFPDVLEQERLHLKATDADEYDHVWEGKCKQWLTGAIYANELRAAYEENRIREVAHDPALPVYTAWDIGHTDDTAIWWFQLVMDEIHLIDSYAMSGGSPAHFAGQILGAETSIDIIQGEVKVAQGELIEEIAHRRDYQYAVHWLPHDAKAKTLAAHGKSVQQQLQAALGYEKVRIGPGLSKEDGIAAARTTFARCFFDKEQCSDGLKALRNYHRELQRDEVSLQRNAKHDWSSHFADAFRYLAASWPSYAGISTEEPKPSDAYGFDEYDEEDDWMVA